MTPQHRRLKGLGQLRPLLGCASPLALFLDQGKLEENVRPKRTDDHNGDRDRDNDFSKFSQSHGGTEDFSKRSIDGSGDAFFHQRGTEVQGTQLHPRQPQVGQQLFLVGRMHLFD